ncbi:MAG: ATP-binding domain-containing protein, partial [Cyanobacteria bacterium REEB65]|nr:ATP-binding domain-containing protein [Cyanobacteria bacterium REEB65]
EAAFVAGEVRRLLASGYVACPADIAVLYRTSEQAHSIALALRSHDIAYRVRGGRDLFARPEVRDAMAYLRLVDNLADGSALARVIDIPPRGLAQLATLLRAEPVALAALPSLAHSLRPQAVAGTRALIDLIADLHARKAQLQAAEVLDLILETTAYLAWLAQRPDAAARLRSLAALRTLLEQTASDLGSWLASVRAHEDLELVPEEERVHLATIHAAKGSEWPVVFLTGVEQGLLPHAHSFDTPDSDTDAINDEVRVMYVAISRARTRVYLSGCRRRQRAGPMELRQPSQFLSQLPAHLLTRIA